MPLVLLSDRLQFILQFGSFWVWICKESNFISYRSALSALDAHVLAQSSTDMARI
jgi:hypothetical protein